MQVQPYEVKWASCSSQNILLFLTAFLRNLDSDSLWNILLYYNFQLSKIVFPSTNTPDNVSLIEFDYIN
jgi:hypothetical protein